MFEYRTIMEFYATREVGVEVSFLIRLETSAEPPPMGSIINILSEDYEVLGVDYSIDQAGQLFPEVVYRRNVIMRLKGAK